MLMSSFLFPFEKQQNKLKPESICIVRTKRDHCGRRGGGELSVEVGVQGVRGSREELVRARPMLGGVLGAWGGGGVQVRSRVLFSLSLNDEPVRGFGSRAAGRGRLCRREGERVSDGEASAPPLSRSDGSLFCSSCRHHSTQRAGELERGKARDLLIPQQ